MDADLIGIPLRVTIGPKKLAENKVEIKFRRSGEVRDLDLSDADAEIARFVREELQTPELG